ncbi:MAG: 23S rRNA (uracil(1939)-C(5))-methyltransferase RlmD [Clostridia bacterium]
MSVSVDKEYILEIIGLTHKAEGVAKYNGFTVFVPQAIPGDKVLAKVISKKKTYARALIQEIIVESIDRVKPFCIHYYECGGCQLQHLSYKKQLQYKKQQVIDSFQRIGKMETFEVNDVIGMEDPKYYRNKSSMPVGGTVGDIKVGFYKPRSHEIAKITECKIQENIINTIFRYIEDKVNSRFIEPYNEKEHSGILRHLVIRVAPSTQQVIVVFVVNKKSDEFNLIAQELIVNFAQVKGVILNVNSKKTNVIFGDENIILAGVEKIFDELLDKKFLISAKSFYQINGKQTKKLYQSAINMLELSGDEKVIDAYCGTGTIGLILAGETSKVIGVELNEDAVKDAKENALVNGVKNIEFVCGKAEEEIPKMINKGFYPDIIVVDPPRKGCDESLINTIIKHQIEKILYISCNPSTLARDIKYLNGKGYNISGAIQPIDMFPHTSHVETITLIEKK